jgi:hypothetical protein
MIGRIVDKGEHGRSNGLAYSIPEWRTPLQHAFASKRGTKETGNRCGHPWLKDDRDSLGRNRLCAKESRGAPHRIGGGFSKIKIIGPTPNP